MRGWGPLRSSVQGKTRDDEGAELHPWQQAGKILEGWNQWDLEEDSFLLQWTRMSRN